MSQLKSHKKIFGKPRFDIRVPLLGNMSAGKSTSLNAIFRGSYSPTSFQRETMAVHTFQVRNIENIQGSFAMERSNEKINGRCNGNGLSYEELNAEQDATYRSLKATNHSHKNSEELKEYIREVPLQDFGQIRDDVDLMISDFPGTDQGAYVVEYIKENWLTFDAIVCVLDSTVQWNKPEHSKLLKLIHGCCSERRDVPVIILLNKVDNPEEEKHISRVSAFKALVEEEFNVSDRVESLKRFLDTGCADATSYPVFIPVSSRWAAMLYTARSRSLEEFRKCDMDLIDEFGPDELMAYKDWKRLGNDEKYKQVYQRLKTDQDKRNNRLDETNFGAFMKVLKIIACGKKNQREMISKKLNFEIDNLALVHPSHFMEKLKDTYIKYEALDRPSGARLSNAFWSCFERAKSTALDNIESPLDIDQVQIPLKLLIDYAQFTSFDMVNWETEKKAAADKFADLVREQIALVVRKFSDNPLGTIQMNDPVVTWCNTTVKEWIHVLRELLGALYAFNLKHEDIAFKREVHFLCDMKDKAKEHLPKDDNSLLQAMKVGYSPSGLLLPIDEARYRRYDRLPFTDSYNDPKSWGYVVWKYSKFMDGQRVSIESEHTSDFTHTSKKQKISESIDLIDVDAENIDTPAKDNNGDSPKSVTETQESKKN